MPSTFVVVTDADVSALDLFESCLDIDAHVSSMQQSRGRAIAGTTSGTIGLNQTGTWRARHIDPWFTRREERTGEQVQLSSIRFSRSTENRRVLGTTRDGHTARYAYQH